MNRRRCIDCEQSLPIEAFEKTYLGKAVRNQCRACRNAKERARWKKAPPRKISEAERERLAKRLEGFTNEPTVRDEVIAAARGLGSSFLLRDLRPVTGLPKRTINRVLCRLAKQGVLTRRKVRVPTSKGFKMQYLYTFAERRA